MEKEQANRIVLMIYKNIQEMNDSIVELRDKCSAQELKMYRRGVGHVMSELFDRILDPIFREHPDLIPKDANYVPGPGPKLGDIVGE